MLLRGDTTSTHTPPSPPSLPPSPSALTATFTTITATTITRHHYCTLTATRHLHLLSSPEPFGRSVFLLPGTNGEERGRRTRGNHSIKSSCVRAGDQDAAAPRRGSVVLHPPPLFISYLWCPCRCALYVFVVFDWFGNSDVPAIY